MKSLPDTQRAYQCYFHRRGPDGGASEAEAENNSVSCVTCVSCQQAASGAPKCTICDQVCHAIIPCTTATDDEDVLEHMTYALTARAQQLGANRKQRHLFFCLQLVIKKQQERRAQQNKPILFALSFWTF